MEDGYDANRDANDANYDADDAVKSIIDILTNEPSEVCCKKNGSLKLEKNEILEDPACWK